MPQRSKTGTKGLYKKHNRACQDRTNSKPTACSCPWYGKYKGFYIPLASWADQEVDPNTKGSANAVLTRAKAAIDNGTYSAEGEHRSLGSGQRFKDFVNEWQTHYAEEYNLTANSLQSMLNVLTGVWGTYTLEYLAGASTDIERWLNEEARKRKWVNNTWNRYYELLSTLFNRAMKWKSNGVLRMATNPLSGIERRVGTKRVHVSIRLEEEIEARLLAACDQLNRPQHQPHSRLLTWAQVDAIRAAVAAGETQKSEAERSGISRGLCCQIIKRDIWAPEKYKQGTKGDEMRLRVMAAFHVALRKGEMLDIQLKHIHFKPIKVPVEIEVKPGLYRREARDVIAIELPPANTKGGKTVGEVEFVYVSDPKLIQALTRRRFELGNRPDAYVFGTKDGRRIKGFRRMWTALFTLAGLDWGRDKGIVWHTTRHEGISRALEAADGDILIAQQFARHRDRRTTEGYTHARQMRVLATVARLGGRGK